MSSWKKASKTGQKYHRERGQLVERSSLGLLEKKKDYKLRSQDFQKKRDAITNLKRKILEKNPDEFYYNMVNTHQKDGIHQLKNKYQSFTDDEIRLMKSQDKNYIRLHQQMERKKIDKIKETLHIIETTDKFQNSHRFFVDAKHEAKSFNLLKQLNTTKECIENKSNRLTNEQSLLSGQQLDKDFIKAAIKQRKKKYKELVTRIKREKSLRKLEDNYDLKLTTENPEDEYDSKFDLNTQGDGKKNTKAYAKIIPRKK